jgi:hypothetical protein
MLGSKSINHWSISDLVDIIAPQSFLAFPDGTAAVLQLLTLGSA